MVRICKPNVPLMNDISEFEQQYPFDLSSFQKHAIDAIISGNHTLVTAHTGSGKTLPAEFAIKYFTERKKKVVYTSPIKALSNQKYHEFTEKFPDISFGILTGDIKFNPDADVIIMTTEILRNTIFNKLTEEQPSSQLQFKMDIENELACVIFDEVHYINDADRGRVWEECIINLPKNVQMVLLSATLYCPEEFASWIEERNDDKNVFLASTYNRVVPLTHYCFMSMHDSYIKKIKDPKVREEISYNIGFPVPISSTKHEFDDRVYSTMKRVADYTRHNKIDINSKYVINSLVEYLNTNNLLPAITFVFSRKQVEVLAKSIDRSLFDSDSKIPSIVEHEAELILRKLPNHKEYTQLPEYTTMISLFKKGIAIHHSGVLPILREMVELFFAKGYIKLLFATETFAVGINMPTKTVIFTSFYKFDGNNQRCLLSHEYTQMAGRAGRRGLDTEGHVIHCNNLFDFPDIHTYKRVLGGQAQVLSSKFKVSYNLLLNLIHNEMYNDNLSYIKGIEGTMLQREIDAEAKEQQKANALYIESYKHAIKTTTTKTPKEVCIEYNMICNQLKIGNKKRRRDYQNRLQNLEAEYYNVKNDTATWCKVTEMKVIIEESERAFEASKTYVKGQIKHGRDILLENAFIVQDLEDEGAYHLSSKGTMAKGIQETPNLVMSELLHTFDGFSGLEPPEIVGIFSCFTNITCAENIQISTIRDESVKTVLYKLEHLVGKYHDNELNRGYHSGVDYSIHYNLVEDAINWCYCENETDCKDLIQDMAYYKNIFIGEFAKAIMKINNIANEIKNLCEDNNNTELMRKMEDISSLTLKYIVTNQSLYV